MFRWREHLGNLTCPNEQVKLLNEVLLNIYTNCILNEVKTIRPRSKGESGGASSEDSDRNGGGGDPDVIFQSKGIPN